MDTEDSLTISELKKGKKIPFDLKDKKRPDAFNLPIQSGRYMEVPMLWSTRQNQW